MVSLKTKCQIVLLIVFSIGVGGLILRAQVPLEVGRRDWSSAMPDGEGKGLVLGTCTQCHSLNPIVLQRKTAVKWELLVRDMIARGAQVHVQEIAPISAYLARSFGPDAAPFSMSEPQTVTAVLASQTVPKSATTLPEGPGKDILLGFCTGCHVLNKTTEAHKDEAGWRANVKDMVRLGAKVKPEDEAVLVAYLVQHFPREASPSPAVAANTEAARRSAEMYGMGRANTAPNPAHLLPDDEGKGLILASCVQCHSSLGYILGLKKTPEGWRHSVNDMISRGAQVTPQEAEIIISYLSRHMAREKKAE